MAGRVPAIRASTAGGGWPGHALRYAHISNLPAVSGTYSHARTIWGFGGTTTAKRENLGITWKSPWHSQAFFRMRHYMCASRRDTPGHDDRETTLLRLSAYPGSY